MFLMLEHKAQAVKMWTAVRFMLDLLSVLQPVGMLSGWGGALLWAFYKLEMEAAEERVDSRNMYLQEYVVWTINFS